MKALAAPFRFLLLVIGGWLAGRAAFVLSALGTVAGEILVAGADRAMAPTNEITSLSPPASFASIEAWVEPPSDASKGVTNGGYLPQASAETRMAARDIIPVPPPAVPQPAIARPAAVDVVPPAGPAKTSRWSGSAWLFARPDNGRAGLQLGGSQAGARLAYRLAGEDQGSLGLAARVSTPLRDRDGAEAAAGFDWHLPGKLPVRVSVERRIALGREGRNAWSAYAAAGFYRGGLPGGLEVDGYGQAGVVGARARDLFVDGAVRVGRSVALPNRKQLVAGAGMWGAAQPGVSRLDLGPRVALSLPIAGATATAAIDLRIRVAGNAEPRSGVAFTLAADF